jgi:hypothetical protein
LPAQKTLPSDKHGFTKTNPAQHPVLTDFTKVLFFYSIFFALFLIYSENVFFSKRALNTGEYHRPQNAEGTSGRIAVADGL